jgi:Flp pilus assembly protein TadD
MEQDHASRLNEDGVYLFQQGQYARARESFARAAELKPEDPGLAYNLGQCYDRLGDVKKAEETYHVCLDKDPNHAEGRHALARLLMLQGRRSEAEQTIQTWLVAQPKVADAYAADAWLLRQDGDINKTQVRLQQALKLDPHNVRAMIQLGLLYEYLDRADRALVLYERALEREPDRQDLREHINQLLARGVKRPMLDS